MKILMLVPSGGGVRNFLFTPFVDRLLGLGEVSVWHGLPERAASLIRGQWDRSVAWEPLPAVHEGVTERVMRQAKGWAQIYWKCGKERSILAERLRPSGSWKNRALGYAAAGLGRWFARPGRIGLLDQWHEASAARTARAHGIPERLQALGVDAVFSTHQRTIGLAPIMAAARSLRIPAATFIYSWDNLPKGRITVPADLFFVWADSMKQELLSYYPSVSPDRVQSGGTPQFELYTNSALIRPRKEFLEEIGLDPGRPVICFSGDDYKTSPHDAGYLADLAEAFERWPGGKRPQILFRPCPTDRSYRFDWVMQRFPSIARSTPLWEAKENQSDWSQVVPDRRDDALLANVVFHSDAVVNVGSTMAMDFAVYDKPAIYIAYPPGSPDRNWKIDEIYRLPHFRSVHQFQPVYWARSKNDLPALVQKTLSCPGEKSEARRAWLEYHVRHPIAGTSERLAMALADLAKRRVAARQTPSANGVAAICAA